MIKSVNNSATVVGVPGREMPERKDRTARFESTLDHANLPDPISEMFRELRRQEEKLRIRVKELEARLGIESDDDQAEGLIDDDLATSDLPDLDDPLHNPPQYGG